MVKGSAGARHAEGDPAVLGQGLQVVGKVRGEGDLRVEAQVDGDITVSGHLHLAEAGRVTGSVQAESVTVSGLLEGDASARGMVTITATGRMRGNVRAPELSLEEGGGLDGRVEGDFELPDAIA